jgi:hypothetical protein
MEGKLEFGDDPKVGPPASNGKEQLVCQGLRQTIGKETEGCGILAYVLVFILAGS